MRRTGLRQAPGEVDDPRDLDVGRDGQRDHEARGARAHRGDVGEVLRSGAHPDVGARAPRAPEVAVLDEDVGGHDQPAGQDGDDGGVVTRAEIGGTAAGQQGDEACEELGLGEVGDGLGHEASLGRGGLATRRHGAWGRPGVT
ncbi:hypothetical protein GCM10025875_08320 [Litorihabitans aurantiacus]|uniref:Uncharacterized protein n=1 Tax=Litorihabitans aurantiacus TaxID=1930061 RepID=A0AA37XD85_9MICO|nr:hypothetical protein GCM10025875_08320 [Litorihabitans aurantiacus]